MGKPTSALTRRFTILCVLVALGGLARGQQHDILGRENAQFARKLFERGLSELAEGVCAAIEAADKAGAADMGPDVLATQLLRLELRLDKASRELDATTRKDEIKAVLADMSR